MSDEKNCGNCANWDCVGSSNFGKFCHRHRPFYSKKPEPQGWEERFNVIFPASLNGIGAYDLYKVVEAFIRQVSAEEREKGFRDGMKNAYSDVKHKAELCLEEQNKHRSEK